MVLGFNDEDRTHLEQLRCNGHVNGVPELSIVGPDRIHELEPRASADATCALWCPSTGFVDPFEVAIAALENAVANGVTFMRSAPVEAIEVAGGETTDGAVRFTLATPAGEVRCRYLINAAGNGAADISHMAGAKSFRWSGARATSWCWTRSRGRSCRSTPFPRRCPRALSSREPCTATP